MMICARRIPRLFSLTTPKRFYPCRYYDSDTDQMHAMSREYREQIENLERNLCSARSLLYRLHKKYPLDDDEKKLLQEQLSQHKNHRKDDIRYEIDLLHRYRHKVQSLMGSLSDEESAYYRSLLSRIQFALDSYDNEDAIMDRNHLYLDSLLDELKKIE